MTLYYDFEDYDCEYEIENGDLEEFLVDKFLEESGLDRSFTTRKAFSFMIARLELLDDDDLLESYESDMKDYFYNDAYDKFKEARKKDKDPLGWIGMKQSDFI